MHVFFLHSKHFLQSFLRKLDFRKKASYNEFTDRHQGEKRRN